MSTTAAAYMFSYTVFVSDYDRLPDNYRDSFVQENLMRETSCESNISSQALEFGAHMTSLNSSQASEDAAPFLTNGVLIPDFISRDLFVQIAADDPARLLQFIRSGLMDGPDTALALEVASESVSKGDLFHVASCSLRHPSAIAREAAIYALVYHGADPTDHITMTLIRRYTIPDFEPSRAVREVAEETMDLF